MFDRLQYFLTYLSIKILTFNYFTIRKIIGDILKEQKYNSVLDFGCGIGILAPLFSPKQYLGFDIDARAIAYAKNKYPKYSFQIGDATKLRLHKRSLSSNKKFDLIMVVGVLHHLSDQEARLALRSAKLLLASKGTIVAIEAISPIYRWNIFGHILRSLDKGHYVRTVGSYRLLIGEDLEIERECKKRGGVLDYGVFVIRPKTSKT